MATVGVKGLTLVYLHGLGDLMSVHTQGRLSPPQDLGARPLAAGPSPYIPLPLPLSCPFFSPLFRGNNPLTPSPSPPFPFPAQVSRGPGVSPWGKFFKSRWLQVKFHAFLGKIRPLNTRGALFLGADSLKIGIF